MGCLGKAFVDCDILGPYVFRSQGKGLTDPAPGKGKEAGEIIGYVMQMANQILELVLFQIELRGLLLGLDLLQQPYVLHGVVREVFHIHAPGTEGTHDPDAPVDRLWLILGFLRLVDGSPEHGRIELTEFWVSKEEVGILKIIF